MAGAGKTTRLGRLWAGGNWLTGLAAVVALLLVVVLLAEIVRTERQQREVTAAVLSDYADIAAWQYIRRLDLVLRRSLHPPLHALRETSPDASVETLFETAREASERCACPHGTPTRAFRLQADALSVSGAEPLPGRGALRRHLADRLAAYRNGAFEPRSMDFLSLDGEVMAVGFVAPAQDPSGLVGYLTPAVTLESVFETVYRNSNLLPPTLMQGEEQSSLLALRVRHADRTLYETDAFEGQWLGRAAVAEHTEQFTGLTVETALKPVAAEVLLVGGTPRSRLPLLASLLGLAVVLGAVALWQFNTQRQLVRMRTDTVARISHELRTPLTQIRLFVESLRLGRSRYPGKALAVIDRESRRLDHLVNNVLRFGERSRDPEPLNPETLVLADFLQRVIEEFGPLAEHYGVTVTLDVADDLTVDAEPDALRRIILNLLDNAARFSPADGRIQVSGAAAGPGRVCVRVDDQGPGVAPDERERVWHMFGRVGAGERSGSGIGLAVVRHEVDRHGGDARVADAPAGGARFEIELPGGREAA